MADQNTTTQQTTQLPQWAADYMTNMLGRTQALSNTPYTPYGGQRIADYTPLQQQAFDFVSNMRTPAYFDEGAGILGAVGKSAPTPKWTDSGIAQSYMSPYMQNVTDIAKRETIRDADIAKTSMAAKLGPGSYGGYRHGVMESELDRNTMQRLSDLQSQGLQQAYTSGATQFNADRAANQEGLRTQVAAGTGLGALGTGQMGADNTLANLQLSTGGAQQNLNQKSLDTGYSDFTAQRNWPYEQLSFMNSILRGTPTTTNSTTNTTTNEGSGNIWSQVAGAGTGLYSLWKMFGG
jgi:hypothetical protein